MSRYRWATYRAKRLADWLVDQFGATEKSRKVKTIKRNVHVVVTCLVEPIEVALLSEPYCEAKIDREVWKGALPPNHIAIAYMNWVVYCPDPRIAKEILEPVTYGSPDCETFVSGIYLHRLKRSRQGSRKDDVLLQFSVNVSLHDLSKKKEKKPTKPKKRRKKPKKDRSRLK